VQRKLLFTPMIAALILFACAGEVCAQEETPRFEIGAQFTTLTIKEVQGLQTIDGILPPGSRTEPGVGGRFTYNVNDYIAAEAEVNFFPMTTGSGMTPDSGA
jgi:hypothetical protein